MSKARKPKAPPRVGTSSEPGHTNLREDPVERELDDALQDTFPASDPVYVEPNWPARSPVDEGLKETFPASDPVSVRLVKPAKPRKR